jgi:hypothetical protein
MLECGEHDGVPGKLHISKLRQSAASHAPGTCMFMYACKCESLISPSFFTSQYTGELTVRDTENRGRGLFTQSPIPSGALVAEYVEPMCFFAWLRWRVCTAYICY